MKIIDKHGLTWVMNTTKSGHTKIQCLESLANLIARDAIQDAEEDGYYCSNWLDALQILVDGGYIDLKHPLTT